MIALSDNVQLRNTPSKASIRPFERPGSSKGKSSSRSRPSTSSSGKSSKSRDERRLNQAKGDLTAHVMTNLAALESHRRERTPSNPSIQTARRVLTRPPTPAHSKSASQDRGRPLAPSSSWTNLRFRTKSSSKESVKEDGNDVIPAPNNVGNAGSSTIRRFQSLGFLRRKGSISVGQSPSSTSLASRSGSSSHGHSNSASNSSSGSQNNQHQQQAKPIQPSLANQTHSVSAATVFPSLSRSSTFTLTVTTGPSSSSSNNPPPVSFARPPKANPVSRKSISLYETTATVKRSPSDSGTRVRPSAGKRLIPLPATKTRVVARTPCTYDVTTTRPARPRSSSLPLDPVLQAAITSTSQSTSRSEDAHMQSSHISDPKDSQMIKAHGARRTSHTRPLNTSTSLTDIFSTFTLTPMALRTPGTSHPTTPRAHNRHAAVYRPPPPVDVDGYAQAGHPKPALSLSMPTGVSIVDSLPSLSNTLLPPASANPVASAGRGPSSRNASPASPYPPPLFSSSPSSSSPLTSARPPPRAPVPESPGASPENRSKPLPTIPTISGSFSAASSPTVTSPLRTKNLSPWARQRAYSTARVPDTKTSLTGADKSTWAPALNYLTNPSALKTSPKPTRANIDGVKHAAQEKINYTSGGRPGTSNTRTIYATTPTIPISSHRRPSLPITPTTARFEYSQQAEDLGERLWGYFEQSGLTSSKQSRELWRSRSANALSDTPSSGGSGSNATSAAYEANLTPTSTTQRMRKGSVSGGVGVNMRKSVHAVYASPSPSGSSSHTPQTPNSGILQTPPLTSGTSPSSPYQRRPPPLSAVPRSNSSDAATTIKLSSKQTIILREPPSIRSIRTQRPTHLISQSLPSPKADSFNIDTPAHEQVLFLDPARSQRGMDSYHHSPASFFYSPYPSPGVTFPVTPVTPMTPWMGSGKDGDGDSLVLPPSPSPQYGRA